VAGFTSITVPKERQRHSPVYPDGPALKTYLQVALFVQQRLEYPTLDVADAPAVAVPAEVDRYVVDGPHPAIIAHLVPALEPRDLTPFDRLHSSPPIN
jgi:hypothetical protein